VEAISFMMHRGHRRDLPRPPGARRPDASRRRFLPPSGSYCRRWVSWPVILAMRPKSFSTWRT